MRESPPGLPTEAEISDFGFARQQEGKKLETYCGSRPYAPPEIIMGEPCHGEMADIWSMDVILCAMVAGRLPFKDSDATSLLSEISRHLHFPSRVSDECKDLIQAMLTFTPKERLTLAEIKSHPWMTICANFAMQISLGTSVSCTS